MSRHSVQERHPDGTITWHDLVWRRSRRFPKPTFPTGYEVWVGDTPIGDVTAHRPLDFQGWTAHAAFSSADATGPTLVYGFCSRYQATQYLLDISPRFRPHSDFEESGFGLGNDGVLSTLAVRLDMHRTRARPVERDGGVLVFRENCYIELGEPGVTSAVLEHRVSVETSVVPGTRVEHD